MGGSDCHLESKFSLRTENECGKSQRTNSISKGSGARKAFSFLF